MSRGSGIHVMGNDIAVIVAGVIRVMGSDIAVMGYGDIVVMEGDITAAWQCIAFLAQDGI